MSNIKLFFFLLLVLLIFKTSKQMEPVEKTNEEGLLIAPEPLLLIPEKPKHTCIHDKIAASFKPVVATEENQQGETGAQEKEHKTE